MASAELQIPIPHAGLEWVSALHDVPADDAGGPVILFAHGAGAPMRSPFMATMAAGLVAAGLPTLRFNYAYSERMEREERRLPPDRRPFLEEVHGLALARLRELHPERPIVLAGKSMGGRMGSYLAAEGAEIERMLFFGYPLHPPGKPDRLRSEHFPQLRQPTLFLQGTRDALCDLELLRPALETLGGEATLEVLEDADHDFGVLKRSGKTREDVLNDVLERATRWLLPS